MELIISIVSGALLALSGGVMLGLGTRRLRAAREIERTAVEVAGLADEVLASSLGGARGAAIPVDSPAGQAIMRVIQSLPCPCPDCEEERRIAHVAKQQGGES